MALFLDEPATEAEATGACAALRHWIEGAENSNQASENAVCIAIKAIRQWREIERRHEAMLEALREAAMVMERHGWGSMEDARSDALAAVQQAAEAGQ